MDIIITEKYLEENPTHIFVFGDNTERVGLGGAAILRYCPNTYGFITKKYPSNHPEAFYTIEEYQPVFEQEMRCLIDLIESEQGLVFLISRLGAGLANRYKIFEKVIEPEIKARLSQYDNVKFLW